RAGDYSTLRSCQADVEVVFPRYRAPGDAGRRVRIARQEGGRGIKPFEGPRGSTIDSRSSPSATLLRCVNRSERTDHRLESGWLRRLRSRRLVTGSAGGDPHRRPRSYCGRASDKSFYPYSSDVPWHTRSGERSRT